MKEKINICERTETGSLKVTTERNMTVEMSEDLELYVIYNKRRYVAYLEGLNFWYIILGE